MNKKILVVLLADAKGHENMGRALHALLYAKQSRGAGAEVELIFDGGGAEWAAAFPSHEHFKELYAELLAAGVVKGVCRFCAGAFGVESELALLGATLIDEGGGHPDIGKRVVEGWTPLVV